ncbi:MAG: hypothetical protein JWR20_471 [Marmoricola sp.]|nr:hypothetical protein [Marmoricola sp.]
MLTVTAAQRRARLVRRHLLTPAAREAATVEEVVAALVCLHATEPATVHLSVAARSRVDRAAVERALYADRTVVKQLAMRRTLFAFPADLLPHVWCSASARVAAQLGTRLAGEVVANGLAADGPRWVEDVGESVLEVLADGPATTAELRERLPELARRLEMHPDKSYGGSFPVAPRLLSTLAASGRVLRGENDGGWRTSRPRWTRTEQWLREQVPPADRAGADGAPLTAADGYRELVRRWLRSFGPGTTEDLVWWLGATRGAVRAALADLGAVEVVLAPDGEGGAAPPVDVGWLLPDDLADLDDLDGGVDPAAEGDEPAAALLPVLDATVMGWKQRDFYLAPQDAPRLFDRNGNAGTTAWWDGRVVGCWVQDPDGRVVVVPLHDLEDEPAHRLQVEADRLSAWLDGEVVATVYPSPLMRSARPA